MDPPGAVVPRWEWRSFGNDFPRVQAMVEDLPHGHRRSSEIYILSAASDANVKIRDGLLDVKRLLAIDGDLERWSPVLKSPFPIGADQIAEVARHWAIAAPPLARARYTVDQFLAEIVSPSSALHTIAVEKDRRLATIDGCTVEAATLAVLGTSVRTVAVESADAAAVRRVVDGLGLTDAPPVNYVSALKRLVGLHTAASSVGVQEGASS
jgi:hypothetical protein